MTENTQPDQSAESNQATFSIEKIYVRDLSLEVPNAPQAFLENDSPQINIQLGTRSRQIEDGLYETVLSVTVSAKVAEDKTLFLVEIAQAGLFQIRNFPETDLEPILMITCPNILFPYAREAVSAAITRAGFQSLLLAPVNFEALYQAQKQQAETSGEQTAANGADEQLTQ